MTLTVHDLAGREVVRLQDGSVRAGVHRVAWNAEGMRSGVYFARIEAVGKRGMARVTPVK